MTFLSRGFGLTYAAIGRWSPSQPQNDSAIPRVAGPQLFHFWYSWRPPLSWTLAGIGVGTSVGVAVRVGMVVGPGVGVVVAVGVKAFMVNCTMATSVGLGVKTASPGGDRAYLIRALNSDTRQARRS